MNKSNLFTWTIVLSILAIVWTIGAQSSAAPPTANHSLPGARPLQAGFADPDSSQVQTSGPTPGTPAPVPALGSAESAPACGLFHVTAGDAAVVEQTGSTLALLVVRAPQGAASWRQQVGALANAGAQVILEMYPRPWTWDGSGWTFDANAQSFLELAAELHAAGQVLAVFGPVDEPYAHDYTTAQLQALYRELKTRAPDLPVYSTFGRLHFWEDQGDASRTIAPGTVDYASPHYYPFEASGYRRETYIAELEAEIDILRRRAPDTQLIWLVQAFALPTHPRVLRMPTGDELRDAGQIALDRGVSILYYTYNQAFTGYTDWLAQHPEMLGSVCPPQDPGNTPTPAATSTPTRRPTATPTATSTPTRQATATPTRRATATPTRRATATPTRRATATPTRRATATPTRRPTAIPTGTPRPGTGYDYIVFVPQAFRSWRVPGPQGNRTGP